MIKTLVMRVRGQGTQARSECEMVQIGRGERRKESAVDLQEEPHPRLCINR